MDEPTAQLKGGGDLGCLRGTDSVIPGEFRGAGPGYALEGTPLEKEFPSQTPEAPFPGTPVLRKMAISSALESAAGPFSVSFSLGLIIRRSSRNPGQAMEL